MSYKDKYEHALDRFTAVCKDMFTDLERLKRENNILKAERDKWKTDHELLVDDYKQILIDLNKKDAENKRLKETIMELKEMQRKQTLWIAAELGLNHADTEQIIKESIVATTMEMP